MASGLSLTPDQPTHVAALAELQRFTGRARGAPPEVAGTTGNLTVTSTLRDDHYTVVTVGEDRGQGGGEGSAVGPDGAQQISGSVMILPAVTLTQTDTTDGVGRRDAGEDGIARRDIASFVARPHDGCLLTKPSAEPPPSRCLTRRVRSGSPLWRLRRALGLLPAAEMVGLEQQ